MGVYMCLDAEYDHETKRWAYHKGSLLYIGQVYEQTFMDRLNQHLRETGENDPWPWIEKNHRYEVTIKAARVVLQADKRISSSLLDDIENLLIGVLQPRANYRGTRTYRGQDLEIYNTRKFKPLPEYVSTGLLRH